MALTREDAEKRIREFIVEGLRWTGSEAILSSDYELIDNDVLDSLGIQQLVAFIEDELDVEVADEDLIPDNFVTLSAIAGLVVRG